MKRIFITALFCAMFAAAAGAQTTEIMYTYDAAGNRITRKGASAVEAQAMTSQPKTDESVKPGKEAAVEAANGTADSSSAANPSGSAAVEEQKKAAVENKNEKK